MNPTNPTVHLSAHTGSYAPLPTRSGNDRTRNGNTLSPIADTLSPIVHESYTKPPRSYTDCSHSGRSGSYCDMVIDLHGMMWYDVAR